MKPTSSIQTVKNQANINTSDVLIGYLVNGSMFTPLSSGNRHYQEVQKWIAAGNTPEPAYTQKELDDHAAAVAMSEALEYLKDTDWYVARKADIGTPIPDEVESKRVAARIAADGHTKG